MLVSIKFSSGAENYKYFIGYLHNDEKVKSLHILPPKTSAYVKCYDEQSKWICFLNEDDELLKKYNTVWYKISTDIKKIDSEPAYNKKILKTKIKSDGDEVTDFYDNKNPKVDSNPSYLTVISLDSTLKKYENHYPEVFLKECNC